jgi:hypothetical protein
MRHSHKMNEAAQLCAVAVEVSWSFITRTREFKGQNGNDQFGSVMLKAHWRF